MTSFLAFFVAALTEIAACFAVLAWVKQGASTLWLIPAAVGLAAFAYALTYVESPFAGRTYAAYCGVYILVALAWGWAVEGQRPDAWDLGGTALTLVGAWMILMGPR